MSPAPVIALDGHTRLRPWAPDDAPALYAAIDTNREHIARWLSWAEAYTPEAAAEFIERVTIASADGRHELCLEVDGAVAGGCGWVRLDQTDREGEIGYWLAAPYTGRGLMTRAAEALTEHGFRDLGLHRVVIAALAGNTASRAIPGRLGFREEGTFRSARRHRGEWHDIVWYATTEDEWR
ncbi:MAG: GNAT family protein, partial [Dehalococcoidia bacterium]